MSWNKVKSFIFHASVTTDWIKTLKTLLKQKRFHQTNSGHYRGQAAYRPKLIWSCSHSVSDDISDRVTAALCIKISASWIADKK